MKSIKVHGLNKYLFFIVLLSVLCAPVGNALASDMGEAKAAVRVRDYSKAFNIYKKLAEKNNKEAQYQLAAM